MSSVRVDPIQPGAAGYRQHMVYRKVFPRPDLTDLLRAGGSRVMATTAEEGSEITLFCDFGEPVILDPDDAVTGLARLLEGAAPATPLSFSGWVGFFGYEFLASHMGLRLTAPRDIELPGGLFARPQTIARLHGDRLQVESLIPGRVEAFALPGNRDSMGVPEPQTPRHPEIRCNLDVTAYERIFAKAREEILRGNTYQIKISLRYETDSAPDPVSSFVRLWKSNPAPESFLLRWDAFALVSCSPESVITRRGDLIRTRPIGGTWPRASTDTQETLQRFAHDPKETAEHNMIVDLERNDLSRVCRSGSVRIEALRALETYEHLHHLVTSIAGELRTGVGSAEILAAMLPGGSITGCPKYRTMELIDQMEPVFRGPYTGSFGRLHDNGDLDLNLIIRTMVCAGGRAYVQAGGGIVIDSTPAYEYRENRMKAEALLQLLQG